MVKIDIKKIFILLSLFLSFGVHANFAMTVPSFFKKLVTDHREKINSIFVKEYNEFCENNGIDSRNLSNRKKVIPVFFYQKLLTCTSATDCSVGGILKIPYFWHYIKPNPRYDIVHIPTSKSLKKVPPPEDFKRHKSYADCDRLPRLYLSDLVSENPKFKHPSCGKFSTFGWCSEREMAFNALMITLGYECKVFQEGIHVWSEVLLDLEYTPNKMIKVVMIVDSTFDHVSYYLLNKTISQWKNNFGKGSHVKWYNTMARSEKQLKTIREMEVSPGARKRIGNRILLWLRKNHPSK